MKPYSKHLKTVIVAPRPRATVRRGTPQLLRLAESLGHQARPAMGPKRRRLALSCVACRRRKVKCDRTYPTCVRCQKGGSACDYVSYTGKDNALPTPSEESPHVRREESVASWTGKHFYHSTVSTTRPVGGFAPSGDIPQPNCI